VCKYAGLVFAQERGAEFSVVVTV